jgi:hypothetical protein
MNSFIYKQQHYKHYHQGRSRSRHCQRPQPSKAKRDEDSQSMREKEDMTPIPPIRPLRMRAPVPHRDESAPLDLESVDLLRCSMDNVEVLKDPRLYTAYFLVIWMEPKPFCEMG